MSELWLAALIWLLTHLGISNTPIRGALVRGMGIGAYRGIYSLLALASLVYFVWVYTDIPRFDYFWLPDPDLYWVSKLTMPFALILMFGGFMVPDPAAISDESATGGDAGVARGVARITRHPFQWAVVIWCVGHIVANGDWASILFFSTFLILSLAGTLLMDAKKRRLAADAGQAYAPGTSNLPFAAIVRGENKLVLRELGLPLLVGLLAYGLLYYGHEWMTGSVIV